MVPNPARASLLHVKRRTLPGRRERKRRNVQTFHVSAGLRTASDVATILAGIRSWDWDQRHNREGNMDPLDFNTYVNEVRIQQPFDGTIVAVRRETRTFDVVSLTCGDASVTVSADKLRHALELLAGEIA